MRLWQQPADLRRARCSPLCGGALCCNLFRGSFTGSLAATLTHGSRLFSGGAPCCTFLSAVPRGASLSQMLLGRGMLGGGSLRRNLLLNGLASR